MKIGTRKREKAMALSSLIEHDGIAFLPRHVVSLGLFIYIRIGQTGVQNDPMVIYRCCNYRQVIRGIPPTFRSAHMRGAMGNGQMVHP